MLDQGPQGGMDGPLDFDCYLITLAPSKGQLISKCPYEKSVWTKIATKIFPRFLFLKFTTSRLLQNRVYLLANRT